jgi:hypothetical protein
MPVVGDCLPGKELYHIKTFGVVPNEEYQDLIREPPCHLPP